MKSTSISILALTALMMAGCSSVHLPGPSDKPVAVRIEPNKPLSVDRPILLVPRNAKSLTWVLDAASEYRFAGDGIVIDGRLLDSTVETQRGKAVLLGSAAEAFPNRCQVADMGRRVTCDYRSIGPAAYKYTISVRRRDERPVSLDPMVVDPF